MRILLVDDEPAALERLSALLAQAPEMSVVGTARNGREAAEAIAALHPDLVLLDIQMPERSGLAVAAALPSEECPEVVFVTVFELYAADAFEVEAADSLLKPVRFDRLRQAIERARRRKAQRTAFVRAEEAEAAPAGEDPTASESRSAPASPACRSRRSTGSRRPRTMCCCTPPPAATSNERP